MIPSISPHFQYNKKERKFHKNCWILYFSLLLSLICLSSLDFELLPHKAIWIGCDRWGGRRASRTRWPGPPWGPWGWAAMSYSSLQWPAEVGFRIMWPDALLYNLQNVECEPITSSASCSFKMIKNHETLEMYTFSLTLLLLFFFKISSGIELKRGHLLNGGKRRGKHGDGQRCSRKTCKHTNQKKHCHSNLSISFIEDWGNKMSTMVRWVQNEISSSCTCEELQTVLKLPF